MKKVMTGAGLLMVSLLAHQTVFAVSREECAAYAASDGVPDEEMPAYIDACVGESTNQYSEEDNYAEEYSSYEEDDAEQYYEEETQSEEDFESGDIQDSEWEEESMD